MISRKPVFIANEIGLKRQEHRGAFLVVEGRDDRLFCERFIARDRCRVQVAEGKESVLEVVRILETRPFEGVVGLVDTDFDGLEGRSSPGANVVSTQVHDLECLLVRSSALQAVLFEHASDKKVAALPRTPRELLLAAATPIGCLRLHSRRSGLNLRFQDLNYDGFVARAGLEVNRRKLVHEVRNRSQRQDLPEDDLLRALHDIEAQDLDPWSLCTGDDLIGLLSLGLRHTFGTKGAQPVSPDNLRRELRLAFSQDAFDASPIAAGLRRWQQENPAFQVLPLSPPGSSGSLAT